MNTFLSQTNRHLSNYTPQKTLINHTIEQTHYKDNPKIDDQTNLAYSKLWSKPEKRYVANNQHKTTFTTIANNISTTISILSKV